MNRKPPVIAVKLLRSFVHVHYLEEVEGDLEETFHLNVANKGLRLAQFLYWIHVLKAIKFYPVKRRPSNILHEIKHFLFLKLAARNIWKRKGTHLINAIGLAAALVSFIVILNFTSYEQGFDKFHVHADRIARIGFDWGELNEEGENESIYASNVPAMGKLLETEMPEIESQTTFVPVLTIKRSCHIRHPQTGSVITAENAFYADDRFLSIFSFPTIIGSGKLLSDPHTVVVTSSFARKLFGDGYFASVIGKSITILTDKEENFTITAVVNDIPSNSHIAFDYLISYETINSPRLQENIYWSQFYCYVLLRNGSSISHAESKLPGIAKKVYGKDTHVSLFLQPLSDIHLKSKLREELGTPGSQSTVVLLMIVAYVVLLMGWLNFTSLFMAMAVERVREVGIKKVLGSTRMHLVIQFLSESIIVNLLTCLFSVLTFLSISQHIASWLGVPHVIDVSYTNLAAPLVGFVVLGSLITGALPAWILSSYKPLNAMEKQTRELPLYSQLKQALPYFQFSVCFAVIASASIMKKQLTFMQNADIGISMEQTIAIKLPPAADNSNQQPIESFQQIMRQSPMVDCLTLSSSIPGTRINISGGVQRISGEALEGNNVLNIYTDENFVKTFQIRMLAGKHFQSILSDTIPHVLLNEAAVRVLHFNSNEDAIGQVILWQKNKVFIEGVFANYNHVFLKEAFEPMMLTKGRIRQQFICVKFKSIQNPLAHGDMLALLRDAWSKEMSNIAFDYEFLEDHYRGQYDSIQREREVVQNFASLSLVICAIGLFSVSAYMIRNRLKEIAIRKVLGATSENVIVLLLKERISLVLVSSITGCVVTYFLMASWLQKFAFTIDIKLLDFALSLLTIVGIVIMSIGYHAFNAGRVEPTNILNNE